MNFQSLPGLDDVNPATMPSFGLRTASCGMSVLPGVSQNSEKRSFAISAGVMGTAW